MGIRQADWRRLEMTNSIDRTGIMKAVKIVVCDDDKVLQEILLHKIEKYCDGRAIAYQVRGLNSGEELLELEEEQMPDILFLDIQMPGRNGMDIAEQLRRQYCGMILIFVTGLSEYVYEAFDVGAFHFLVKPFDNEKLQKVLCRALQQWAKLQKSEAIQQAEQPNVISQSSVLLVKRGGISTKVRWRDIIYAEVFNRKVMLHTTHGNIEYYGKLTDLSKQAGADFYRTHRAYLVNLEHVEKYSSTTIWTEQGTVPVSKKQFAGFVRQYMQYINRRRSI